MENYTGVVVHNLWAHLWELGTYDDAPPRSYDGSGAVSVLRQASVVARTAARATRTTATSARPVHWTSGRRAFGA